jgi:hypothetical protein
MHTCDATAHMHEIVASSSAEAKGPSNEDSSDAKTRQEGKSSRGVRTYLFIRAQDLVLEGVSGRPPGSSRVLRRALLLLMLRLQVLLGSGPAEAWVLLLLLLLLQALMHTWGLLLRTARAVACLVGHALHSVSEAICEIRPRVVL